MTGCRSCSRSSSSPSETAPPQRRRDLFQPFHRAHTAESSRKKGWGLGLTRVRGLVEGLHGDVMLASYPNEGTTFTVDLPVDSRGAVGPSPT